MITWSTPTFAELTTIELYELLKLRVDVFVVEQTCPYPELDGKDTQPDVRHLLGYEDGQLVACARLLPAGTTYDNVSIGRIATKAEARGAGLGHKLLTEAIKHSHELWPNSTIDIGAQQHLEAFYQSHGFVTISEMYLEDDIPHIDMRLQG